MHAQISFRTWGPAFCPLVWMRGWEATDRKKGKFQLFLFAKEFNTNGTNWDFPFFRSVSLLSPLGGRFLGWFWAVLGRYLEGQNWKRILMITRVGFGRTELSLRLSCTEFCALSSGHGPRGGGFYGGSSGADLCIFFGRYWGGQKWQNLKSILMITRVGFGRTELSLMLSYTEFCALSSGHGPRGQGFEGFCKILDFHDFFGGSKMEKIMKIHDEHASILVSGALDPRKMIS